MTIKLTEVQNAEKLAGIQGKENPTITDFQALIERLGESKLERAFIVGRWTFDTLANDLTSYFDPRELHAEVQAGAVGTVLGLPVLCNVVEPAFFEGTLLALAELSKNENGQYEIVSFVTQADLSGA